MMGKKNDDESNFSELRKNAEEKLKKGVKNRGEEAPLELEHELNVHRVELEMQNEELITTQQKLEKTLEEYSELFDYAPVSYFILDKNGVIVNVNNAGIAQLAYTKPQLTGKHLSSFLTSKSYQDDFYRYRNQVLETGKNLQFECEIKRNDGTVFFALINSTIIKDEKKNFKHFFLIISDITEQKEQEHKIALSLIKEMELNEMKSQFITIASHEFRTPLSTILTSSELIEKYDNATEHTKKEKHYRKIQTSVQRLKEILIDFMSASDIERGNIKNCPIPFNLVEFVENLTEEIKSFNGTHQVKYKHIGPYNNVILDKKLLRVCMGNLLINAYKYAPDGGLIEITTEQSKPNSILISIKDNGIGIPENDQTHIFKQFFRAKNAENIQGTGLGLHITQCLTKIMGGKISFTSQEKVGSTFFLKFE